jgi:hypothetical protein
MFGWETPLDVVKGLFLMDVDEDTSIDRELCRILGDEVDQAAW